MLAVTTLLPLLSAASSSPRAGSMPPMTSTTMSTSSRATSASASVVSDGRVDVGVPAGTAHGDAGELQRRPYALREFAGLLVQQAGDLRPDDAAAEQPDA